MFPSSSYMDPYFSQNKEQVPYPSYPFYQYPVPRPDPSAQPASYAPWPYHFNPTHPSGYPYPPGYYGPRPPFPYELPPPNFPNYYHPSFAPMPSYPAKYPQVDHTTHQTHCCGCPNHVCHGTDSPKVKIEEETPDVDQTKMPNNSHPFFWFSPRNKVQQDEIEQPKKERKGAQFPWPIVWMPEDEMKEKEKKNTQFPWPFFWMREDESEERKDQLANKQASEKAAKPSFRIIPLKFLENGDKDQAEIQKPPLIEKKQGDEESRKDQMEQRDKSQAEVKSIPVLEKKDSSEKVGQEQPTKEKDSTADRVTEKKRSKLPPVCLRIDPLPSKRPTNGSFKEDKNKKEVRVVDVKSAKDERKGIDIEVKKDTKEQFPERKNDDAKRGAAGKDLNGREIQGEELKDKLEKTKVRDVKRSQISEQDAALLIQSAYRGYNVRRWDPLKKLKKIRSVQEKAQELLKKLQDVEESSKPLEKEQLILSESIMNLLLQLDTIQGLHPTVREARKSVARELVSLQEKLDSLEKQKAVEMPTNEVSQPQMEVQPTAINVSSEGCKLVSEQVELQASEAPTLQWISTQEEDEKAHESLNKVDGAVELNLPQSATECPLVEEVPVINEEDACGTTREESQVAPLVEETRPNDLVAGTISGKNYPEAKPCLPQTENSQGVGSTENVVSDADREMPSAAIESHATDLAPAVTSSESNAAVSCTSLESEMLDTAVTSSITEEIHDTEVAPGVAVTDGTDTATTLPETKLDGAYEEKGHVDATESNAEEAGPEVAMSGATTKEVSMLEESHDCDAGARGENVELQTTEDGKPNSKKMKVRDNEIVSDASGTASSEVELHATEVPPEGGNVNDGVAGAEKVELLVTDADEVKDENKSVEENEVTRLPGNEVAGLPDTESSEGFQQVEEANEPEAEVLPDAIQTNAMEVPPEVGKLSVEEKKLVEENEKLRVMLEKLMEAGRNQLDIISGLNERVKGLEKKLEKKAKKSKVKVKKHKPVMASSIEVL